MSSATTSPDPKEVRAFLKRAPLTMAAGTWLVLALVGVPWQWAIPTALLVGVAQYLYGRAKLKRMALVD